MRAYAYKVVRGELRFENTEDEEKILRLMERWRKAINISEHRDWHLSALPKSLQTKANEFIEQQRKIMEAKRIRCEPVLHQWMMQLYPENARFTDKDFGHVALTTLTPYETVVAEFCCRRCTLLKEASDSPIREGCKRRHVLETSHPKLVYDESDKKFYLIYVIRKLVSLPTLDELEAALNHGFNIVSVDINLDDLTYAVFHLNNGEEKRLHIGRCRWNVGEWIRVRRIDAFAKKRHGMSASRHWRRLKRRGTGKAAEGANQIMETAKKFNAKAIIYEKLSNRFPKGSKNHNYKIHCWYHGRIVRYLVNKARWEGLAAVPVSAWGTSSRCPRCNAKLPNPKTNSHRDWQTRRCERCRFTDDRDHIACTNIARKFNRKLLKHRLRNILQIT